MNSSPTDRMNPHRRGSSADGGTGVVTDRNRGRHFKEVLSNLTTGVDGGWRSQETLDTKSFRQEYHSLPVRWHTSRA